MHRRILILAIVTAVLPVPLFAQPVPTQSGRALDMSFQIGSGGYNAPASAIGRFNSQLYITGQVTGFSRFHGDPGYVAANELRLDLPSARLRDFRRRSVGMGQVLEGTPYRPSPYFDRTSTAFGILGITKGLTSPGTNIPRTATPARALVRRLYSEVVSPYEPIIKFPIGRLLAVARPVLGPARDVSGSPAPRVSRPGAAALLGIRGLADREQLALELFRLVRPAKEEDKPTEPPEVPEPRKRLEPPTEILPDAGVAPPPSPCGTRPPATDPRIPRRTRPIG